MKEVKLLIAILSIAAITTLALLLTHAPASHADGGYAGVRFRGQQVLSIECSADLDCSFHQGELYISVASPRSPRH